MTDTPMPGAATETPPAEATPPASTTTPAATTTPSETPPAEVKTEGVKFDDYLKTLSPADQDLLKKNGVDSYEKQFKWVNNLNSMLGKKGLVKPGEDATQEEKDAYTKALHKELGAPENGEYEFDVPKYNGKPVPDEMIDQGFVDGLAGIASKHGLSQQGYQEMVNHIYETYMKSTEVPIDLNKAWGDKAESNAKVAQTFFNNVMKGTPEGELANQLLGNNPAMQLFAYKMAQKLGEDKLDVKGEGAEVGGDATSIRAAANAKRQEAEAEALKGNYAKAKLLQKESDELYNRHASMSNNAA